MHTLVSGQKVIIRSHVPLQIHFFHLTASKSMKANKWHAYTEKILYFLRKQSLLCASSGFSFRFVLQEST